MNALIRGIALQDNGLCFNKRLVEGEDVLESVTDTLCVSLCKLTDFAVDARIV